MDFWEEKIANKNNQNQVVYNHNVYYIGDGKGLSKGFDGDTFEITFNDGRIVITDDLWYNGELPKEFWDKLPDNAKSIKEIR